MKLQFCWVYSAASGLPHTPSSSSSTVHRPQWMKVEYCNQSYQRFEETCCLRLYCTL